MNTRNLAIGGFVVAAFLGTTTYAMTRGSGSGQNGMPGMSGMTGMTNETSATGGMAGMLPVGDVSGLNSSADGYTLKVERKTLTVARLTRFSFRVMTSTDQPVRNFQVDATKKMHLIIVRRDLTNYQHIHPTMATDGTWSVAAAAAAPGSYRAFVDFATGGKRHVLGINLTARGASTRAALPAPRKTVRSDGYTIVVHAGMLMAGREVAIRFTVSREGKPVTNLDPYLGNLGHLVILRETTLQYLHVHPTSAGGSGPEIHFVADLAHAGRYRAFLQFQTNGAVHTAAFTLQVHAAG